jgi:glyoxylase-like metal-dependent hydrolase (beta-lactamase superfamily II)
MKQIERNQTSASKLAFNREINFDYGVLQPMLPGVRRMVANNASPLTFKGTNTYVVGHGEVGVIDPGPDDADHIEALIGALSGERISHILVTHTHRDHTDGVARLKERTGATLLGYGQTGELRGVRTPKGLDASFVDGGFTPDKTLREGDTVRGGNWALDVIHTPGHAPDHLCFGLLGERTVFSGDHVMGWNTTVVAPPEGHMGRYIGSLQKLMERNDKVFLPAHGGRIATPQRVVKAYIMHRKWREGAIYTCLENGLGSIPEIVAKIYPDLNPDLLGAAALSVLAHLEYLSERGLVDSDIPPAIDASFVPA